MAERVVVLALESVEYNEERAEKILNAVLTEESTPKKLPSCTDGDKSNNRPVQIDTRHGLVKAKD